MRQCLFGIQAKTCNIYLVEGWKGVSWIFNTLLIKQIIFAEEDKEEEIEAGE